MHDTAYEIGQLFFKTYFATAPELILEIGSQNINGSLRTCAPPGSTYIGVDLARGEGVDIVLDEPHTLPFADEHFDATISSSCLEHDQLFWLTFLEMLRVTKIGGYVYINVPTNGWYHSYPYDNWRFYPDAGLALIAWARHQGRELALIESFIAPRKADVWNDFVSVFRKGGGEPPMRGRIADRLPGAYNIRRDDSAPPENFTEASEDMRLLAEARARLSAREQEVAWLAAAVGSCEAALSGLAAALRGEFGRDRPSTRPVDLSTATSAGIEERVIALAAALTGLRTEFAVSPGVPAAGGGKWRRMLRTVASRLLPAGSGRSPPGA
jgi:SAM-dependent methyltransferase